MAVPHVYLQFCIPSFWEFLKRARKLLCEQNSLRERCILSACFVYVAVEVKYVVPVFVVLHGQCYLKPCGLCRGHIARVYQTENRESFTEFCVGHRTPGP